MEKVSIVMPCYNDGRYLEESIHSAQQQTYPNIEIVLVDDGSDDPLTLEMIHKLEQEAGIRVLHGNHGGPAAARNLGIRHAEGEFIFPLDADDRIEPEYVEEAAKILRSSPDVGIVYCRADYFEAQEGEWELEEFSLGKMLFENMIFNAALFRKSDWEKAGGYRENLVAMEDWDFWLAILELGLHPVRIDKLMFHYRIRQEGSSFSNRYTSTENWLKLHHEILIKHISLYQRECIAYCDWVREKSSQQKNMIRKYRAALEAMQKKQFLLNADNRWVLMSEQIPWKDLEQHFEKEFLKWKGKFSSPVRLALGIYILQGETGLSDQLLLPELEENPYMQVFCGLLREEERKRLTLEELSYLHERMTPLVLERMNEAIKG